MSRLEPALMAECVKLQSEYIHALDRRDMTGWLGMFSESPNASYICISEENDAADLPISLMLDDCRARIEDRILFVTKIWQGTFQEYSTRHFVQLLDIECLADGSYSMISNFTINYTMPPQGTAVLSAGVYRDIIVRENGRLRFLHKRAVYDTNVLPAYIVYPF
jgi:3-phenylpropionate/cinnamic acid dioxygenase small subunit